MIYFVEIICLIVLSILIKEVSTLRFYNRIISHTSHTFYEWAEFKEKIAYKITRLVYNIPSFSLAPSDFEYIRIEEEYRQATSLEERLLIRIHQLWLHIKGLLGNVVADLIILVTFLIHEQIINLNEISNTLLNIDIDILVILDNIINFCSEKGNIILITIIIYLTLYSRHIRNKSKQYEFEAIWNGETEENIKKVAEKQRIIEKSLYTIHYSIYKNINLCKENIRKINALKDKLPNINLSSNYVDYSDTLETLKKQLIEISKLTNGASIYAKHNKKMLLQLNLLGLLPNDKFIYFSLDEYNKPSFEKIEINENLKDAFMYKWMSGIAILNGLERYLNDSAKRKYKYNKLLLSTETYIGMSKMIDKIKS